MSCAAMNLRKEHFGKHDDVSLRNSSCDTHCFDFYVQKIYKGT